MQQVAADIGDFDVIPDHHLDVPAAVRPLYEVIIDSDAHSAAELDFLAHGVGQARRGWPSVKDVLNTRTLPQLLPLLKRTMG